MKNTYKQTIMRNKKSTILKFENQKLTSYSGLTLFDDFITCLNLREKLQSCFKNEQKGGIYQAWRLFFLLVIHVLIGFKRIREINYYRNDPLVSNIAGLRTFPDPSTISRALSNCSDSAITSLRSLNRGEIIDGLSEAGLQRITIDCDGSVLSTKRHAEGTAIGFNKMHKGRRSYYPLFTTIAQSGQVFDFHHRPGNVHDSNGACGFLEENIRRLIDTLPDTRFEMRGDGAFFSKEMVTCLNSLDVDFTLSVPFLRLPELKSIVEDTQKWHRIDKTTSCRSISWAPRSWEIQQRFVLVRRKVACQNKEVLQLDLFEPLSFEYEYKVIVTNKKCSSAEVIAFHEGRGNQEALFGEIKTFTGMAAIPFKHKNANQVYLLANIFAHNLMRRFQMKNVQPTKNYEKSRGACWTFKTLGTLRKTVLNRAGKITAPQNVRTLTIAGNEMIKNMFEAIRDRFKIAA